LVLGKLQLSKPVPGYDWNFDLHSLNKEGIAPPQFRGSPQSAGWDEFLQEMAEFRLKERRYFLEVQSDGTFRVEDVEPGTYKLEVAIGEPRKPDAEEEVYQPRRTLGTASLRVVVSEAQSSDPL
jgi:hypothetical protein